jgi:cytochrome b6-f complex subunit 5
LVVLIGFFLKTCFFSIIFSFFSKMVELLLSGIVLGLIAVTLTGLFVAAYLQYKRGNELAL